MLFDLSTPEKAKISLDLYKKGKIDEVIFYHFTTYPANRKDELYKEIKPIREIIQNENTPLGSFLVENNMHIAFSKNNIASLCVFDHEIRIEYGGILNNLASRLYWDNGVSGFFVPKDFDYSCICFAPEILRTIDKALVELKTLPSPINLEEKWKHQNFKTYRVKAVVPIDKLEENPDHTLVDAAEKVGSGNPYDYDSQLMYLKPDNCNFIKVLDVEQYFK
ncbi:hypothetical protein [Limosilactobacillus reuteri]|nr:hypothetical protein [Limosilactobacillus reuteri]